MTAMRHRDWWLRALLGAVTIAAVAFFISTFLDVQRDGELRSPAVLSWGWLIVSVAIGVGHLIAMAGTFAWLVGFRAPLRVSSIFLFSQGAKYVPGKVWGIVTQKSLMGEQSRLSRVVGANVAMATILLASQVAMAGAALVVSRMGMVAATGFGLCVCALAGVVAASLQRAHRAKGWRLLVPWARPGVGLVTGAASAASLTLTALAWVALFGGGLGCGSDEIAHWTAVSGASFVAGMLSVLPSGLGLREAAFVALGEQLPALASTDAPMLALFTRGWLLVIDAIAVLLGVLGLVVWRARTPE